MRPNAPRPPRLKQEGAVMLIVVMMLLMTMATATFAIHSTAAELRAAGHVRQALQTQYVAETALTASLAHVDQHGPKALLAATAGQQVPPMSPDEPELASGKTGFRVYLNDLQDAAPTDRQALGRHQSRTPFFVVDINDHYTYTGVIAGEAVGSASPLRFLRATYTARGRTRVPGEEAQGVDSRAAHETAANARAHGISGPF